MDKKVPAKKTATRKPTATQGVMGGSLVTNPLAQKAIAQLKQEFAKPENRERLLQVAQSAFNDAKRWYDEKKAAKADRDELGVAKGSKAVFGQRRLEERSVHITEQIDLLAARSVEVASALEPLRASSKTVDTALKVSVGLPVVKRKMAHRKIDDQLDELEEALVQFVMAGLGNAE
ncbi:MAG: hypothetical protein KDB09_05555 [Acidimicrobiales bacterium]|nr:hypothetical protein [Acidimicrobiales bacterium]